MEAGRNRGGRALLAGCIEGFKSTSFVTSVQTYIVLYRAGSGNQIIESSMRSTCLVIRKDKKNTKKEIKEIKEIKEL